MPVAHLPMSMSVSKGPLSLSTSRLRKVPTVGKLTPTIAEIRSCRKVVAILSSPLIDEPGMNRGGKIKSPPRAVRAYPLLDQRTRLLLYSGTYHEFDQTSGHRKEGQSLQ